MHILIKANHVSLHIQQAMPLTDLPVERSFTTSIDSQHKREIGHTKISADGNPYPKGDTRTDHVALIDHATGLMWSVTSLGHPEKAEDGLPQEKCMSRCAELRLLGHADWRLPTRDELAALVDASTRDPAINTNLFPGVLPRWHWTSTPLSNADGTASASGAWFVDFGYGGVGSYRRNGYGFALAVRAVGQ